MEIVKEEIVNGKKHIVLRYTEEEKAAMKAKAEEHKKQMEEKRKHLHRPAVAEATETK